MAVFAGLSYLSRVKKLQLFYEFVKPTKQTRVLDVGAEINPCGDRGLQLIDGYQWKKNVTAVNLSSRHIDDIKEHYPEVDARVCDACSLPWPDKYFDVVYSNAVIEHLGDYDRQKKMASEIMRVGRMWFVTTPNRRYPFEFHLRLPFVTWLPRHGYRWFGKIIGYNHVKKKYAFGIDTSDLCLMTATELKRCFPDSRVIRSRITFMAETLIVFGPENLKRKTQ